MPRKEREERLARAGQKITLATAGPSVLHSANTHAEVLGNVFQVHRSENMCEHGHEQRGSGTWRKERKLYSSCEKVITRYPSNSIPWN